MLLSVLFAVFLYLLCVSLFGCVSSICSQFFFFFMCLVCVFSIYTGFLFMVVFSVCAVFSKCCGSVVILFKTFS